MRTRTAVFLSLGFGLLVGLTVLGSLLYRSFIGLDPSAFPAGEAIQSLALKLSPGLQTTMAGAVLALAILLAVGVFSFLLVRGARPPGVDAGRREFLAGAGTGVGAVVVAGTAGAARALFGVGEGNQGWSPIGQQIFDRNMAFTHPEWKESWKGSQIQSHRRFGRTGWNVSDIVLGTGRIVGDTGEQIARQALDRGVNYFDTSPDYAGSGSEQAMGRAMKGKRDQLFIATKFCTPTGHLPPGAPVARYVEVIEDSLRRLGTDYVDLCHVHSVDEVGRLMDPNVHEAFDRLKQQGKARFLGFSTHTPNLVEVVTRGIESGRFDVMMVAYHHGLWGPMPELIARARKEQDMGVVAMKTLKGAKHRGLQNFQAHAESYSQAALKWALSNPDVSCAVISFFELQHVDEYLAASGKQLTAQDVAILEEYDRQIAGSYCGPHCGQCLSSCPEELPIHDVLRYRMYFEDYGWEKEGLRLYSQLEKRADVCASCSAPCTGTCPVGVPIQQRMLGAHELLTLS
jgi:aryl-alcohol dehydrogenase-like predicted oxidoreductase